jgi:hypothetical protein
VEKHLFSNQTFELGEGDCVGLGVSSLPDGKSREGWSNTRSDGVDSLVLV